MLTLVTLKLLPWPADPKGEAGIVSRILHLWLQPLFTRAKALHGCGLALEPRDLPPLADVDQGGEWRTIGAQVAIMKANHMDAISKKA